MPKRILAFAFAVGALALAACNSNNINGLYGSATPTPAPTPTLTPNPTASTAVVQVTYSSSPLPNQPVSISTANASGQPGTPFATQNTDSTGKTTFSNLTPTTTYCFQSQYTPPSTPPPLTRTATNCTNLWGNTNVTVNLAF